MKRLLRMRVFLYTIQLLLVACSPSFSQTADFTATPTSGCAPLLVSFSDNSTGTISSYNWNLGNGATPAIQNPSTSYLSPGTYAVTLTVTGPGGSNTITKTAFITVYAKPAVSFAATTATAGCVPHTVQFGSTVTANQPGSVTYNWVFGDGYSGTGASPVHTYVTPGTYPVSLTVTPAASGCDTTVVRNAYITVYSKPSGGFSSNQNAFCSTPATVTFTNTSAGGVGPYTSFWLFGDGGNGSGSPVPHTYNTGGNFTVTLIVTDSRGCVDTVVNPGYITVVGTLPTFTAPASVCVDQPANFVNTTTGGGGASWDFDDGTSTTGNNVSHSYLSSGTYTAQMSVVIGGCTKTVTKTIIVNPKPIPTITMSPPIPCPKPVTITFTGNTSGAAATNYAWSWRNGGTATGQTVTKTYLPTARSRKAEEDKVKLITTSAVGCMDSVESDTVRMRDITVRVYGVDKGCINVLFDFSTELRTHVPSDPDPGLEGIPYPLPAISWSWDFGDGSPGSTSAFPSHGYSLAGDYTVRCIITTPNGCTDTGYKTVHADTQVHPSFTASPLTVCPRTPVTFINTTAVNLVGTLFFWIIVGDTAIGKQDTSRVITGIKKPGTYTIRLVSNHGGCIDTFYRNNYIEVHPPGAKFTDSIHCAPSRTVDFTNTSTGATSQLWDFGDGNTSTALSPTHTYAALGTYTVKLVAYNSTYGCTDTFKWPVPVFSPFIDFKVSDSAICTNDTVHFQAAFASGYGTVSYSWLFDTFQTPFDTASLIDFKYPTRGRHDVSLIAVSGNNCYDTIKRPGFILVSRPDVVFDAAPPIGCKPLPVLFTDRSTNTPGVRDTIRHWSFGDNADTIFNNSLTTVNHIYPVSGAYTVKLVVVDSLGCTDSLTRTNYVSVHRPHAVFAVSDDSVCAHEPIRFTSTSTGTAPLRQRWDFGDRTTDTGYYPVHRYTDTGLYTVRLIVTDSIGCADTFTLGKPIFVDAPHAGFTMSDSLAICPPLLVTFANTSTGAISSLWDFGMGGTPIIITNPITTFGTPGLYNVYLVVTNINGCTDTARARVRVLGYNGAFTYAPLDGCAPMTVQFSTPINGIPQITWDFDDGNVAAGTSTTATHTYATPGFYIPKVIFSDGHGCSSSSTGLDTIKADEVMANFGWSVPCVGAAFSLYDSSAALFHTPTSWTWYFGGSDTAVGSPVSHTFPTPGNHTVTLVAANGAGCKDTITRQVFINFLPNINVTDDTGVCPGDRAGLVVRGGVAYTWSPSPDSLHNCPVCDTAYVHLDSGSIGARYWVTGVDANGCVNKDSVKVYIKYRTDIAIGEGGEICVGESFRLHAEGAQRYEWLPVETIDSPFIASPLATPQKTTTYVVIAREGTCDVDSEYVRVVVHSLPVFSAGEDEIISLGSAVTLMPTRNGITRIEWQPDTTLSCLDCFRPNASPLYTTTYYATGYNEFGCGSTDSVTVHVRCNGSLVFIPNTFTPNGDGRNDYFFPRGKGIERMSTFRVFNRWGELIFERTNVALNDERGGWDGTYKGKALAPDVYVYTMQSNCVTGEPLSWKGDITLMR